MSFRSWIASASLLVTACCVPPQKPIEETVKQQYVFVVDLSGSITAQERSANEQLLAAFTRTLGFGDRLVVMDAHAEGRRGSGRPFVLELPAPEYGGEPTEDDETTRSEAASLAQRRIQQILAAPPASGTDLFATLHSVAERVREAPGRKSTLVVMSDMLQCAAGVCMERDGGVPDSSYIASLQSRNALPKLAGTCVVVVGADASTLAGQRVRDFWITYFRAAGAELRPEKFFYQITSPENLAC